MTETYFIAFLEATYMSNIIPFEDCEKKNVLYFFF